MLAVSPLRNQKHENQGETMENFSIGTGDFADFSDANLLDSIDFDDLFIGINDGDVLPDLEVDPEILAEFSASGGEESEAVNTSLSTEKIENKPKKIEDHSKNSRSISGSGSDLEDGSLGSKEDEIMSKRDESSSTITHVSTTPNNKEGGKGRKPSSQSNKNNNPQGKRKVKVDWTPELHRRFVEAVEQLGVDKAVPSRILELMGIDCLTRHNIASHLQKYRSHRKHLLTREAEAASWNQRRQMYGATGAPPVGGKRDMGGAWIAPATLGFPPLTPMHHFRPLHVWGHPTMDQSLVHMWPKHLHHSPSPPPPAPPSWAPMPPHHPPPPLSTPPEPSYWHSYHHRVPITLTPGTPCFAQPVAPTRYGAPPVPGIPPPHHAVYKVDSPGFGVPPAPPPTPGSHAPIFDFHPSKESIDAAIGDVLSKPWLPLPLGLKPASVDGVLGELQRQGIPKIPPSCA